MYLNWLFKNSKKDLFNFLIAVFFIPILLFIQFKLINNRLDFTIFILFIALNLFRIIEDNFRKIFTIYNKEISQFYFLLLAMSTIIAVYSFHYFL